ncbi:uncharacterized protein K02A2.6-like [Ornithodoros turicata]|uniref:uncharacterized protein K02A2.6-like n=1 Tax=Ornithodoros turicata TaxID=34597 RepID=UPI00313A0BEA
MYLFFIKGQWWLITADYYSRFPEIAQLRNLSSATVIERCKSAFARHGIPAEVITDNGPQFSGAQASEFRRVAQTNRFRHITSSPRYSQANGLVEASVQIVKNSIKKTNDPYESLLAYRSSPWPNGYSPSEPLMGRRLRTTVPISEKNLLPKAPDYDQLKQREEKLRSNLATACNSRHGDRRLPQLDVGGRVWIIDLKCRGTVERKASTPRSLCVKTNGKEVRCTITHLMRYHNSGCSRGQSVSSDVPEDSPQVTSLPEAGPVIPSTQEAADNSMRDRPSPHTAQQSTSEETECSDDSHQHTRSGRFQKPPERLVL